MRWLGSALFSLWFYAVSVFMVLTGQVISVFAPQAMRPWARWWSQLILFGLPLCGIRYEVTGRENLPASGPMLIASMHQSAFDTLLWWGLVPHVCYIVKIELTKLPLFGRLARLSGQIGVDRTGGAATMRTLLREGGGALTAGRQVIIFPEGTRVRPGEVVALQPGIAALARYSGQPVIPVATDSNLCWGRGFFGTRPGVIHVAILKPIEAGLSREALMVRLQAAFDEGAAALQKQHGAVDNSMY